MQYASPVGCGRAEDERDGEERDRVEQAHLVRVRVRVGVGVRARARARVRLRAHLGRRGQPDVVPGDLAHHGAHLVRVKG